MARKRYRKIPVYDLAGRCIGYEAPEKGTRIIECEKGQADRIIKQHHYSHKVTQNSFVSLLVVYMGGGRRCFAMWLWHSPEDKRRIRARTGARVRPYVVVGQDAEVQRDYYAISLSSLHATCSSRSEGANLLCRHHGGEQRNYLQGRQLCPYRQTASRFLPSPFGRASASSIHVASSRHTCMGFPAKRISWHCAYPRRRATKICKILVTNFKLRQ